MYVTKKDEVHQEGMNLNGTHQHLFYVGGVEIVGESRNTMNRTQLNRLFADVDGLLIEQNSVRGNNVTLCRQM